MRATVLALTLGCTSPSGPTPPTAKAFEGTILARRTSTATEPVEAPLLMAADGSERLVPVDLSLYWPDDGPEFFQFVIQQNFDVSPDGRYLYVAVRERLLRFALPDGGPPTDLIGPVNTARVRVSSDGNLLAFQRPQHGSEMWIVGSDGTGLRRVLPPAVGPGAQYGVPTWAGRDRLLVTSTLLSLDGPEIRVLEMQAPTWEVRELTGLRNSPPFGAEWALQAAASTGRIFVNEITLDNRYQLVEYSPDGSTRVPRILFPERGEVGYRVLVSPDGRRVAASSADGIYIYDIATAREVGGPFGKPDRLQTPIAWTLTEYE
jgi:hypothetical protein